MYIDHSKAWLSIITIGLLFTACNRDGFKDAPPTVPVEEERKQSFGKAFGEEFLLFGAPAKKGGDQTALANVNAHLWQACLETLNFMPLQSVDATGGVIITDWYSTPQAPHERLKVNVRILDKFLQADSLKITVHKQVLKSGQWVEAGVDQDVHHKLENIILSKARHMRIHNITGSSK